MIDIDAMRLWNCWAQCVSRLRKLIPANKEIFKLST